MRASTLAFGAFFALSSTLAAQTSAGAIVGVVRDATGAVIPDARLSVTSAATNISNRFVTDATGNYYFPNLLPGAYHIEAEKTGFKKVTARDVVVAVNQTVRMDLTMPVGDV